VSSRPDAGYRLRRLLAVLTWLARVKQASVSELAARFSMSAEELVADLELAACCGLPPYTPDQLMEIVVDEHEVVANLGEELARPRRLTPGEGFALATAARAILAVPGARGDGATEVALASAVAKLEAALGTGAGAGATGGAAGAAGPGSGTEALRVDLDEAAHLPEVRRAVDEGRQLQVRYYSLSRDEETDRVIDPFELLSIEGRWYLDAYCHRAGGERRFRLDRMVSLSETGRPVDHRREPDHGGAPSAAVPAFVPGPGTTVATLAVAPEGMWVVEGLPTLSVRAGPGGRSHVQLAVASQVWFERLLLRLGTHAEVLDPPELADAGRRAARRLLGRYAETAGTTSL
jgi:predicted DNA-binding transcriptional regulator YafY